MGTVSRNALTDGQSNVDGTDINEIYEDLFNEFNGNIENANIKSNAAIAYSKLNLSGNVTNTDVASDAAIAFSKLATLTSTYMVVGDGSNVAAAVEITGDVAITNAGVTTVTDLTIASQADGDLLQFDGTNWVRVAKGTDGQVLTSDGTDVGWEGIFSSILDYGSSASSSTARQGTALHLCTGYVSVGASSSQQIINLPFASSTSYYVVVCLETNGNNPCTAVRNSASAFTIYNHQNQTKNVMWVAIGT